MTPEQLENIWERYYKADRSRMNTKYGESGLGLAIVRQLVLLHGGKIDVKVSMVRGRHLQSFSLIVNTLLIIFNLQIIKTKSKPII